MAVKITIMKNASIFCDYHYKKLKKELVYSFLISSMPREFQLAVAV
jgi:hypothetical protein